ncbi:DNA-binding protein [Propylenella binzhouense]|uniref:DNA-binding protein n=1 Tax=Propylenella binzhouense TaxID=2555902 RepID=A0A964T5D0_9HYPH|nr:DNA-binding protein [Propylenella binzhouense]
MVLRFRDVRRALRHDPKATLQRRRDEQLPFVGSEASAGNGLLLDTCVYIDQMQGRAPAVLEVLLSVRTVHHSAIAVQELLHVVGVLDPDDRRSRSVSRAVEKVIEAMPPHRLFTPDIDVSARAALYAGILSRTQGYAKDDRMRLLHDCVLYLQAAKLGLTVLTRNVVDFDLLNQLLPGGRVLFYRTVPREAGEAAGPA